MSLKDKEKWEAKYAGADYVYGAEPSRWLRDNSGILGTGGRALDLAMGEGRNAVYLARLGYEVTGVEITDNGIRKARALADKNGVRISIQQADLDGYRIESEAYDVILCFNFLDRGLFPGIRDGLRPGGLLFYETFTLDRLKYGDFKKEWVLEYNDLLRAFSGLRVLRYEETDTPENPCAALLARKPQT